MSETQTCTQYHGGVCAVCRNAFNLLDADKDGIIKRADFGRVLGLLGHYLTEAELHDLIEEMDDLGLSID